MYNGMCKQIACLLHLQPMLAGHKPANPQLWKPSTKPKLIHPSQHHLGFQCHFNTEFLNQSWCTSASLEVMLYKYVIVYSCLCCHYKAYLNPVWKQMSWNCMKARRRTSIGGFTAKKSKRMNFNGSSYPPIDKSWVSLFSALPQQQGSNKVPFTCAGSAAID